MAIVIVVCFTFINVCHGFLLDLTTTRIPPTSAPSSGDTHYNELMKLLRQEMKSRSQLETLVKQLQQELKTTKQEVALKQQMLNHLNGTFEKQYVILKNSTEVLKDEHDLLKIDSDLLKVKHDRMKQNYTLMEAKTKKLEHDILLLKQNCSDNSNTVLTLENKTKHIEQDLNNTNNDINYLSKEVNATKQELFSLVSKVKATEDKLKNRSVEFEAHQNMTSELFYSIDELTEQKMVLTNKTETLEERQNMTALKLEFELGKLFDRVAVRSCAKEDHLLSGAKISFNEVKTTSGVSNINSMKSTGVFTCQKPGLYLISVNVMSDSTAGSIRITNNDYAIAAGFFSISDHNVTTSATVITRLDVNDKVAVISSSEMHVYGGDPSCLNIVQFQ